MQFFVAPIVEGHGEVFAVPILLQRVISEQRPDVSLRVNPAIRVKVGSFLGNPGYFANYLELAARKVRQHANGLVLILLDCEDRCPAIVGPQLASAAASVRSDVPTIIALAHREFETWFVAAARSLRGVRGLPLDLEAPTDPESIRDAKGWLRSRMNAGYNEPNDQPIFTRMFSLEEASCVPSFARLCRRIRDRLPS